MNHRMGVWRFLVATCRYFLMNPPEYTSWIILTFALLSFKNQNQTSFVSLIKASPWLTSTRPLSPSLACLRSSKLAFTVQPINKFTGYLHHSHPKLVNNCSLSVFSLMLIHQAFHGHIVMAGPKTNIIAGQIAATLSPQKKCCTWIVWRWESE